MTQPDRPRSPRWNGFAAHSGCYKSGKTDLISISLTLYITSEAGKMPAPAETQIQCAESLLLINLIFLIHHVIHYII